MRVFWDWYTISAFLVVLCNISIRRVKSFSTDFSPFALTLLSRVKEWPPILPRHIMYVQWRAQYVRVLESPFFNDRWFWIGIYMHGWNPRLILGWKSSFYKLLYLSQAEAYNSLSLSFIAVNHVNCFCLLCWTLIRLLVFSFEFFTFCYIRTFYSLL